MADHRELVEYFRAHREKYPIDQLRAGLLEQGVDAALLDAAIAEVVAAPAEKPKARRSKALIAAAILVPVCLLAFIFWPRGSSAPAPARKAPVEVAPAASSTPLDEARARYRKSFFDVYAHVELSDLLYKAGRIEDAFYLLEEARGLFSPDEFNRARQIVLFTGGRGGWGDGPFDASAEHVAELTRRAAADPKDWESRNYLAHIAVSVDDFEHAEKLADEALKISPDAPGPLGLKAHLLYKKKDSNGAVAAFSRLVAAAPASVDGRSGIEVLQTVAGLGKRGGALAAKAVKTLESCAVKYPDDPAIFQARFLSRAMAGDLKAARKLVSSAKNEASNPGVTAMRGILALQDKNIPESVRLLKDAVARDPDSLYALEKLASLHSHELKDMEAGLPYYIALHRQNPDYYDGEYAEYRVKRELERRRSAALAGARDAASIKELMLSENGAIRAEACLAAAKLGDPALIDALIDRLDDEIGNVVQNADYALFELAKTRRADVLAAQPRIVDSPRTFVRGMALNLFCDLDKARMRAVAVERLSDPEPYVRWRAMAALRGYYADDAEAQKLVAAALASEKDQGLVAADRRIEAKRASR